MKKLLTVLMLLGGQAYALPVSPAWTPGKMDLSPIMLAQLPPGAAATTPAPGSPLAEVLDAQALVEKYAPKVVGLKLPISSSYSVWVSSSLDSYAVGGRNITQGYYVEGVAHKMLNICGHGSEVAYVSIYNVYNASEGGRGAIGLALGVRPINAINDIATVAGAASQLITLPPIMGQLGNFVDIEAGCGYDFGSAHLGCTIMGGVRAPFDLATHH